MSHHFWVDGVLPGLLALGFIVVFAKRSRGLSFWFTFIPMMALAYVCYLLTSYHALPVTARALPIYLVALGWQMLHLMEEFATGFQRRWPEEIFHARGFGDTEYLAINLVADALFTLAALAIWYGWRPLLLIAWFFALMGVMGNAIQHPIYCLRVRGYFPGLFTSLAYWVIGPMLLAALWS